VQFEQTQIALADPRIAAAVAGLRYLSFPKKRLKAKAG